jgi:dimethylhistidine N-methyltransferase
MNQQLRRDTPLGTNFEFASAVIAGLSAEQKTLPCRYFYDDLGSELFERITRLPEYYPARTETEILRSNAREIVCGVPRDSVLIEFGSGSSRKTEVLLSALPALAAYVPLDCSAGALTQAQRRLSARFPTLDIRPIIGNFMEPIEYPPDLAGRHKLGFFPGSTIGNLTPPDARGLLTAMRTALSPAGRLILGIDLKKDEHVLIPAYDDAAGVTSAFNLNLLTRINRELGGNFDVGAFRHRALYNRNEGRVEMHLVSVKSQAARILGHTFRFARGETIHTENSYKYTIRQFRSRAEEAGWTPGRVWTDENSLFSVHELMVPERPLR